MVEGVTKSRPGRKKVKEDNIKKVISITMEKKDWDEIERYIRDGYYHSKSEYFRTLHGSQNFSATEAITEYFANHTETRVIG